MYVSEFVFVEYESKQHYPFLIIVSSPICRHVQLILDLGFMLLYLLPILDNFRDPIFSIPFKKNYFPCNSTAAKIIINFSTVVAS